MLLTAPKAARRAGISVYMLRTHGPSPVRLGARVYWRDVDIDRWLGKSASIDEAIMGDLRGWQP